MTAELAGAPPPPAAGVTALHLFDGPYAVVEGRRIELPEGGKRLLALLALNGGRLQRRAVAETLWPGGDEVRVAGNLRSALWRLRRAGLDLVDGGGATISLSPDVVVDVRVLSEWAERVTAGPAAASDLCARSGWMSAPELLPGWYDEWVVTERERLHLRLLAALPALSAHLRVAERYAEAVEAAMAAVVLDPLSDEARHALVRAHLAEGNLVEARRAVSAYRSVMDRELGLSPDRRRCRR